MMRIVLLSLFAVTVLVGESPAQIYSSPSVGFNHNPAAMSSSSMPARPIFYSPPVTVYSGGIALPYSVYGYGYYGFGGFVDPALYPSSGGYLSRESPIFGVPNDGLAATIPSLAPMTFTPQFTGGFTRSPSELPAPGAADGVARFTLQVPADAEVTLEGQKMEGTGTVRTFVSPKLKSGQEYLYDIQVRFRENGRSVQKTREISVRAGDRKNVSFVGKSSGDE